MKLKIKERKMKAGKILLGVLSGAAAGAAVGMLFAPKKGSDTRRKIADRSNEYVNGTKTKFSGMVDDVSHKFDSVKSKAIGKTKKAKAKIDEDEKIVY